MTDGVVVDPHRESPPESRRDRQRAATEAEIKAVARRQLVEHGVDGISLRGIARDMGMTAPALYRYFASLDELMVEMCGDYFDEARESLLTALGEHTEADARLHASIRAFRRWSLAHPAEFSLMFRAPGSPEEHAAKEDHDEFAQLFLGLFVQLAERGALRLPAPDEVPGDVVAQLASFARAHHIELPDPALWAFCRAWVRIYSVICMEVLGQLTFMFEDSEPYFETELRAVAEGLGVGYVPRVSPGERVATDG